MYNAFVEDIAVINFYFDQSSVPQFTRQESMTDVGFISQLGGLLGLFTGFSFISFFEIIYWVGKNVRESRQEKFDEKSTKRNSWIPDKSNLS